MACQYGVGNKIYCWDKHYCFKVNLFICVATHQTGLSHPNMFYQFGGIRYKNLIKYLKIRAGIAQSV
jgi:hypothetical protein